MKRYEYVFLDNDDVAAAKQFSDRVNAIVANYGENYAGGCFIEDRYFVGRCGELALGKWADRNQLEYDDTVRDDGVPDEQDLVFHTPYGQVTTNVKNSHHPRAAYLIQSIAELERYQQDFYIGMTGTPTRAGVTIKLWGAISHPEWESMHELKTFRCPAQALLLKKLPLDMRGFADLLTGDK